jgi:phosphoserine phosphatase
MQPHGENTSDTIVIHISGPDRAGVTAMLTNIIASEGARLVDIGQSVLHGYLVLSAIVELPPGSDALRQILFTIGKLGLRLDVTPFIESPAAAGIPGGGLVVTLLGELSNAQGLARTAEYFAQNRMSIREISPLTEGRLRGLELAVDPPPEKLLTQLDDSLLTLRGDLLSLAMKYQFDLAVQQDDIFRRNKRLVCMDVDSTFVQTELIDELAELMNCKDAVARITDAAMRGELDFTQSLTERVKLLKGLDVSRAATLLEKIPFTPGAETLVRTLKALGFKVGLVSGGFTFFVDVLKNRFGLDFAFANKLEESDGVYTGRTVGPVIDAQRKAQTLKDMAAQFGYRREQTIAVGDGANDMLMLQAAGLGIAFRAKPKLQAVADISLNQSSLGELLLLMGFSEKELRTLK